MHLILLHGVAVAHGDDAALLRVKVDGYAHGRADFILTAVALADGARLVVIDHEMRRELFVYFGRQGAQLVLL